MIVRLKKAADGAGTLAYVRDDGTATWMRVSRFFVQHDLMHYAVEATMEFRNAFIGLIAGGRDIDDFEKGADAWLPPEALVVEVIVAQLLAERAGSASADEFTAAVDAACAGLGLPAQAIPSSRADAARDRFDALMQRWILLGAGAALELPWPAE